MSLISPIIIILNGPRSSGKDMIADRISSQYNVIHNRFKTSLYEISASIAGMDEERFIELASDTNQKEQPLNELWGLSPRNFMIKVSEEVIKPNFGKYYFGERTVKDIQTTLDFFNNSRFNFDKKHQFFIYSDGGFSKEIIPIVERYGKDAAKIVHLKRDGYDFQGDSRRYLYQKDFASGVCPNFFTEIHQEEGNPQKAVDEVVSLMHTCLADLRNKGETDETR